jgi:hypothetical protein
LCKCSELGIRSRPLARIIAPFSKRSLDEKINVIGGFGKALQELPTGKRLISTPFFYKCMFSVADP